MLFLDHIYTKFAGGIDFQNSVSERGNKLIKPMRSQTLAFLPLVNEVISGRTADHHTTLDLNPAAQPPIRRLKSSTQILG
jgi:hypothetical protein